jgi:hypothetical protein
MEEASAPVSPRRQSHWFAIAILAGMIALGTCWWVWSSRGAAERELAAKAELGKLGALVVMDADRQHVNSVNLSTLQSPDSLDRAVELLPQLPRIQSLHVEGTAFGDEHAAVVGRLNLLGDLALSNTKITDAALDELQGLSRLDTLYLLETAITSAGLSKISQIDSLKVLDISNTKVTGNFEPLRELTNLKHLLVQNLMLDAAAINAFGECPALSRLTLIGSTYPKEALDELRQKRPELAVDQ